MRFAEITVESDRRLTLRDRVSRWAKAGLLTAGESASARATLDDGMRQVGPIARVVLFVLSSWAFGTAMSLVLLVLFPAFGAADGLGGGLMMVQGTIALIAGVAGAELLMATARLRRTGIEDALYLGGLFGILVAVFSSMELDPWIAVLMSGGAFLATGIRLQRGLWIAAAIICLPAAVGAATESPMTFGVAALVTATLAVLAGQRSSRSPALDLALGIVVALLPAIGLFTSLIDRIFDDRLIVSDMLMSGVVTCLAFGAFLATRWKALLYAALGSFAVFVFVLASSDVLPVEWVLVATGVVVAAAARVAHGRLAGRTHGFTSDELAASELTELEPLAGSIAGALVAPKQDGTPESGPALDDAGNPTESSFGGGGSTGRY